MARIRWLAQLRGHGRDLDRIWRVAAAMAHPDVDITRDEQGWWLQWATENARPDALDAFMAGCSHLEVLNQAAAAVDPAYRVVTLATRLENDRAGFGAFA